jgi:hypothetical protein
MMLCPGRGLSTSIRKVSALECPKRATLKSGSGSPYFFEPIRSIVCEGNLRDSAVLEAVNNASDHILSKLAARIKGGMKDMELYLHLDQNDNTCRYYFVDHIARTLFWLEEVVSSDLGLSTAASPRNMGMLF